MVLKAASSDSKSHLVVISCILTANLYGILVIQLVALPFMNSMQWNIFQHDSVFLHTTVVTLQHLQSADVVPWPARSPDLSPIEHD
ncbi:uncharacterized protein TNCV_3418161 [Trichonephila clavipes]|nr:uncharacterized protein TNCV_3418161 [Trichonephila clavipes]